MAQQISSAIGSSCSSMEPEEFETRNALLDHYSSRASDHATQLLTVALIGLTLVQVLPSSCGLVLCLPAVFVAALWVAGRMVYWGYLSDVILHVPDRLGKELVPEMRRTRYFEPTLESVALHFGAVAAIESDHKCWTWFSSLTKPRLATLIIGYLVAVAALLVVLRVCPGFP